MTRDRRDRGRPVGSVSSTAYVLLLLLAGFLGALVLTLDRQAERTNRQQAAQQMRTAAQFAASAVATEIATLRTLGARLAATPALQDAVTTGNRTAMQAIAHANHAAIRVRGTQVGKLAPAPRLVTTIVLEAHDSTVARVTLALPLDRRLITRLRNRVPLPAAATLAFAERGIVTPRSTIASSAAVGSGVRVIASEALAVVDARTSAYLRKLVVAAILTFLLAIVITVRLARPLRTLVGDLSSRAERDALTGLANRRTLDERLRGEFERALGQGSELSLVLLDVDDFKRINDRHGHQCGDDVLCAVAAVLTASVRAADLAGRFGGEEFAVVLPGTGASGAVRVAEQIRAAVASLEVATPRGERVHVTASFGVSAVGGARSAEQLVECADRLLYDAKRQGKNRVCAVDRAGTEDLAVV